MASPKIIGEVLSKRNATNKHFLRDDGKIEATIRMVGNPFHYKNDEGLWEDIDTNLVEKPGNRFVCDTHALRPSLEKFQVPTVVHKRGQPALVIRPQNVQGNISGELLGNKVTYADAYEQTDIERVVENGRLKEIYTLKGKGHPSQFRFKYSTALTAELFTRPDGRSYIHFKNGDEVVYIIQPLMVTNPDRNPVEELPTYLDWKLDKQANEFYFDVPSGISYPYVIDPAITEEIDSDAEDNYTRDSSWVTTNTIMIMGKGSSGIISEVSQIFRSVAIPQYATINGCYMRHRCGWTFGVDTMRTTMHFELAINPVYPTSTADFNSRVESVGKHWDFTTNWNIGGWYNSIDFKDSCQEMISQDGWASGQSAHFMWKNDGSSTNSYRCPTDYQLSPSYSTELKVTYTPPPASYEGSGGLTFGGSLIKKTKFNVDGAITPTGELGRKLSIKRSMLAGITPTGEVNKFTKRTLLAVLTPTSILHIPKDRKFHGLITSTGELVTHWTAKPQVLGNITPTGALSKFTKRTLLAVLTPTSEVNKLTKRALLGAAITPTGKVSKLTKRALPGATTLTGELSKTWYARRTLLAVITPTGELSRKLSFKRPMLGAMTPTGEVNKHTKRALLGAAITPTGEVTKNVKKPFTGEITSVGNLAIIHLTNVPLSYGWGSGARYGLAFQYGYGWLGFEKDIATDYLLSKQFDSNWTNSEGLIQSYMPEYILPGYANTIKRCMIWDSALAAIAFTLNGDILNALAIFAQLEALQESDGSFTVEVAADTGDKVASYHAGVTSLVAYALGLFEQKTGYARYHKMMTDACDWLESLMSSEHNGVDAELESSNFFTVVNVLAYYAFRECYRLTGTAKYNTDAGNVKTFILDYLWDATNNYFHQGIGDDTKNLLAQVFGTMFLKSINETGKVSLLSNIFGEFLTQDTIKDITGLDCFEGTGNTLNISGPQLSYVEGTILAALMSHKIGAYGNREAFINEMVKMQNIDRSHYGSGQQYGAGLRYGYNTGYDGGLLHSSKDRYDFYEYHGAGATAMMVIYACCIIKDALNELIFNDDD